MAVAAAAATFGALRQGVRTSDVPSVLRAMRKNNFLASDLNGLSRGTNDLGAAVAASAAQKAAVVYDLDALRGSFAALRDAFPDHWTHALAIKAAPLAFVVREAVDAGLGVEAASYGEAASALANGCPRERVVFDSPAKTVDELRWALDAGIAVNADSLDELRRIDAVLAERSAPSASLLGLRVNACVDGKGEHAIFAVSENDSKFGHPLSSDAMRAAVVDAFGAYPWLRALHTHVGSAGTSLDMLAQGANTLAGLADEIDAAAGGRRVEALDIGGGLASSMASDDVSPTFAEHAACLREAAPSLFTRDDRAVFTELGRALLQKTAWIVSQVEYVKAFDGSPTRIATLQVGADLLMRQCYRPELATNRISAYDADAEPLAAGGRGAAVEHHLAGPLCFAGDYPQKGVALPPLAGGDYVVLHDTGANTLGLWSRHCSRLVPPVYSYTRDAAGAVELTLQKPAEPLERLLEFWS